MYLLVYISCVLNNIGKLLWYYNSYIELIFYLINYLINFVNFLIKFINLNEVI